MLKHKGDRNYYEFTLTKGQKKPVGTVSLELKKTDPKKSRFTLAVYADDRSYEKKDRNVNEPLQFYSGKDPAPLRDRGEHNRNKEPDLGLSLHAKGRARSAYRSITGLLGVRRQAGLIVETEGESPGSCARPILPWSCGKMQQTFLPLSRPAR